jgi:protein-disulfide isomerase
MSVLGRARRPPTAAALALALITTASLAGQGAPTPAVIDALKAEQPLPDIVEGSAEAPATIIEYASMTCVHCAAFHRDVWPRLKARYVDRGRAKFILREFPLDPLSIAAFMLARCAGAERRDAILDRLFDHQDDWAFADKALIKLKAEVLAAGMTEEGIDACLQDYDLLDNVKKIRDIAVDTLDLKGTPTFFVNGRRIDGEEGLDGFDQILTPVMR